MKSGNLKMLVIGGLLAFGLFSCKSSKKAMDASQAEPAGVTEEVVTEVAPVAPVKLALVVNEEEKRNKRIEKYFSAIASPQASAASANNSIDEIKTMFASAKVPVLIIIHEGADGEVDYDEPTTIMNYLNYLKDQKRNLNELYEVKTNAEGKITELVLIRK